MASSFMRFLDHTQWRTTGGRIPLYEWSARRRDLYLTTHNTYNRQTSMPPVGFKPTISAGERPQTALDRAATGTGNYIIITKKKKISVWNAATQWPLPGAIRHQLNTMGPVCSSSGLVLARSLSSEPTNQTRRHTNLCWASAVAPSPTNTEQEYSQL